MLIILLLGRSRPTHAYMRGCLTPHTTCVCDVGVTYVNGDVEGVTVTLLDFVFQSLPHR